MKLKQLTLKNCGRHRETVVKFHPGTTAITGPNGSGKSTIFTMINWLLTGEIVTTGVKSDNICDTAPVVEVAFGILEFEHNGIDYTVQRYLRPETKKATLSSPAFAKDFQGDKAVTEQVLAILNVDAKVLKTYSIIRQGELFTPLSADNSERSKLFQRLFGTERCATIAKQLAEHKTTIQLPSLVDEDAVRQELATASAAVTRLEQELLTFQTQEQLLQFRDEASLQIQQERSRTELSQLVAAKYGLLPALEQEAAAMQLKLAATRQALAAVTESTNAANITAATATSTKARILEIQRIEAARQSQLQLQQTTNQRIAAMSPPTQALPENWKDLLSDLDQHIGADSYQLKQVTTRLSSLQGKSVCPTCNAPIASQDQDKQQQVDVSARLQTNNARRQQLSTLAADWNRYNTMYQQEQQFLSTVVASLDALPPPDTTAMPSIAECDAAIATAMQRLSQQRSLEAAAATDLNNFTSWTSRIAVEQSQLQAYLDQLSKLPPATRDISVLQADIQRTQQLLSDRSVCAASLAGAQSTRTYAAGKLQEAATLRVEYDRRRRWLDFVGLLEELFHYNGLPKIVAQDSLLLLERSINSFLQMLEADFRVTPTPDLMFNATFQNGTTRASKRLSFGQLGTLGFAFMLSVNFQFLGQLGILLVDEPTAWLDAQRVEALLPTLTRLRDAATARSLQIVVVTHEESLRPAFNHVVELTSVNCV